MNSTRHGIGTKSGQEGLLYLAKCWRAQLADTLPESIKGRTLHCQIALADSIELRLKRSRDARKLSELKVAEIGRDIESIAEDLVKEESGIDSLAGRLAVQLMAVLIIQSGVLEREQERILKRGQ